MPGAARRTEPEVCVGRGGVLREILMSKTIGVIGLGIIGSVWARHYAAAGALAGAWNRTAQPDSPSWKTTAAEVARAADVIQIVVADPAAVRAVLGQIAPELGAGKIVVQSSTIDPATPHGGAIEIEHRAAEEMGELPHGVGAWNPAFDVTPRALVTAYLTDRGFIEPPFSDA